jgi:hypothetical protein
MRCRCHIAQINVARARATIDDPLMAGFVARLDEINALAETSPGFVWRLKDDVRSVVQAHADETVLTNISVWESPEHLHHFVYRTAHARMLRQKKTWFARMEDMHLALWWIAPGHVPSLDEAKERLAYLQSYGESEFAFGFVTLLSAHGEDGKPVLAAPPMLQACGTPNS